MKYRFSHAAMIEFLFYQQLIKYNSIFHLQESPLSSKVAKFNTVVNDHANSQLLNPFTQSGAGRCSPRPKFSKEEYGK